MKLVVEWIFIEIFARNVKDLSKIATKKSTFISHNQNFYEKAIEREDGNSEL